MAAAADALEGILKQAVDWYARLFVFCSAAMGMHWVRARGFDVANALSRRLRGDALSGFPADAQAWNRHA